VLAAAMFVLVVDTSLMNVSIAAVVRDLASAASGSFGLSFGLAVAGGVLLATLSLAFTNMTNASAVIPSAHDATNLALQVALLVPILAGLLGLFNSLRMMRLPDIEPSASIEAAALS
jgi:hypothetical protein